MKYQNEYRDGALARRITARLHAVSTRPVRLMEICGTHTMAIFKHGLTSLFPPTITLISGPGCPVCVTATEDVDRIILLARQPKVHLATFGDFIRVPGSESSLKAEMAAGAKVTVVYSALDAVKLARQYPGDEVVFVGIGFETTAPTVAAAILAAAEARLSNFSVYSAHKLLPPAMQALLSTGEVRVDGFICPGHVTTIIGIADYQAVAQKFKTPCVVTGFEPVDILQGVLTLVEFLNEDRPEVAIQYKRAVSPEGNPKAREIMSQVFTPIDAPWRGLGLIPLSGLGFQEPYSQFDAARRFELTVPKSVDPPGCRCGDVLRGVIPPTKCVLFGRTCTPDSPIGPCMVSSEGTCAAFYRYRSSEEE